VTESAPRVLALSYHLPDDEDVGAFRPWMEVRLLRDLGCRVTVVTARTNYMTGRANVRRSGDPHLRILYAPGLRNHRRSLLHRAVHYVVFALGAFALAVFAAGPCAVVFVGTDPFPLVPLASWLARLKRARLVLDERDLYPETALALGVLRPGPVARGLGTIARRLRRRADHILVATPGQARRLRAEGAPESKLTLLPNADVYLARDAPPREALPDPVLPSLPEGVRRWAVYAGGYGRANDVALLLEAFTALGDRPEVGLLMIGAGEKATLVEGARARGVNVHALGPLPRRVCRGLLARCDLGLHAYVPDPFFSEALPSKVYDYLAQGCPVLFAGTGDTAELLERSGAGLSVPAGDSAAFARVLRLLLVEQPERLRVLAEAARSWYASAIGYRTTRDALARALDFQPDPLPSRS
jgi:glycosyltransferase involved in cell wall biosynthesis